MGDIPLSPSSFKSALSFFSSLDRSSPSPLIPRTNTNNFEFNLKLIIDSQTVARTTYDVQRKITNIHQQQLIPRARLAKKSEETGEQTRRNYDKDDLFGNTRTGNSIVDKGNVKLLTQKEPPKVSHKSSVLNLQTNWGLAVKPGKGITNKETPLLTKDHKPKELLTPDVEAKQIVEAFNKEITPYNQFEVPVDALESEFFKETLSIANSSADLSDVKPNSRVWSYVGRSSICSYELPDSRDGNESFLEPYVQDLNRRQSPQIGAPLPSPPPLRATAPPPVISPSSRSISRESLISSNGGSDASSERSEEEGYGATCDISLMERLVLSHPIWFLPGIQRAGAIHLLQGKEEGCFVVRKSSQSDTMALSVRLPPDKGPYIEHYLIHSSEGRLGLETSENRFVDMAALIAHYASCCDELPVQLTLPKAIRESKSRQQLSSLALLGQEFWSYSPPPSAASSPDADLVLNLNPLMSTFKQTEPATPIQTKPTRPNTLNLLNKNDPQKSEIMRSMSSLKSDSLGKNPPPPPPRWSKPTTPQNNFTVTTTVTFSVNSQSPSNEKPTPSQIELIHCDPKRMSPEGQCNNSTISSRGSIRNKSINNLTSPNSVLSPSSDSIISPDTLSPLSVSKGARHSKRTKPKISKHYQESDIIDSPTMLYYKSGLGDKISDYEDVWTNNGTLIKSKSNNNGSSNLASPDLLQHTPGNIVSLNNNVLSPTDSSQNGSMQRSVCSTPVSSNSLKLSNIQCPIVESSLPLHPQTPDLASPNLVKQQSPFYAEPADSLTSLQQIVPKRIASRPAPSIPLYHRHSNPPGLNSLKTLSPRPERVEDGIELPGGLISSSVDNLSPKQRFLGLRKPETKPVSPPFIKPKKSGNDTWQVDNGWKFVTNEVDINMEASDPDYDSDWPTIPNLLNSLDYTPDSSDDRATLHDMISNRYPDIRTAFDMSTDDERCRISAYDNVDLERRNPKPPPSEISEITEFSDPWAEPHQIITETDASYSETVTSQKMKCASINRTRSFKERLEPLISSPNIEDIKNGDQGPSKVVGSAIRNYALELSQDKTTTFAQNIDNFIACTCESKETNPQIVMRNMRQFMSGMKNYLVKHGEKGFYKEIERERNKLKSTEFLNLDAILEGVMHKLVVRPLKVHLQKLFFDYYTKTGAIRLLADNIQYASGRPNSELGIKPKITLPSENVLNRISQYVQRLQLVDSPLEKLENLLAAIAIIFNSVKTDQLTGSGRSVQLGADDFLPIFVWVLVKTNFVTAEIEAEYMWGLLHPSLFSGEGGYYLTTLSSAVHVLKNFKKGCEENNKNHVENDSVLKVVVPDELHGSILTKTVPARPQMTTKEVCKIIAHKARITNPQDYALYRLTDGEETMLMDNECPQDFMKEGKYTMLAYKRIDAKIAWPNQDKLKL